MFGQRVRACGPDFVQVAGQRPQVVGCVADVADDVHNV